MPKGNPKSEGGSGGKRGHSNMSHWDKTEIIKNESRKVRRNNDLAEASQGVDEYTKENFSDSADEDGSKDS